MLCIATQHSSGVHIIVRFPQNNPPVIYDRPHSTGELHGDLARTADVAICIFAQTQKHNSVEINYSFARLHLTTQRHSSGISINALPATTNNEFYATTKDLLEFSQTHTHRQQNDTKHPSASEQKVSRSTATGIRCATTGHNAHYLFNISDTTQIELFGQLSDVLYSSRSIEFRERHLQLLAPFSHRHEICAQVHTK